MNEKRFEARWIFIEDFVNSYSEFKALKVEKPEKTLKKLKKTSTTFQANLSTFPPKKLHSNLSKSSL
jgi:hypothetical protein